jgi:hypothetical protein
MHVDSKQVRDIFPQEVKLATNAALVMYDSLSARDLEYHRPSNARMGKGYDSGLS